MIRPILSIILCVSLVIELPVLAKPAAPLTNQYWTDQILDDAIARLSKIESAGDAEKYVSKFLSASNRGDLADSISKVTHFPKITRMVRGFSFKVKDKDVQILIDDLSKGEYRVNGVAWTMDPRMRLAPQLEILFKKIDSPGKKSVADLFLPRAEAIWQYVIPMVTAALASVIGAGAVIGFQSYAESQKPYLRKTYCTGKVRGVDPADDEYCDYIFNWIDKKKKVQIPLMSENLPNTGVDLSTRCRKETNKFIITTVGDGGKSITFSFTYQGTMPKSILEESEGAAPINMTLDEDRSILTVTNGKDIYLSKKPEDAALMQDPKKQISLKEIEARMLQVLGQMQTCLNRGKLSAKASESSEKLVKPILTGEKTEIDSDADVVPERTTAAPPNKEN